MAGKTQQEYYAELMASYQPQIMAEKTAAADLYGAQIQKANEDYRRSVDETARSYDVQERDNAVQRLVNEHQIRADMEAAGFTDSGLNRTQQTAVELSYANQKAKIGRVRQQAIDGLTVTLAQQLAKINSEQASAFADIEGAYQKSATAAAVDLYEADLKAETDRLKAENDRIKAEAALVKAQKSSSSSSSKSSSGSSKKTSEEKVGIIKTNNGLLSYDFKGTLQDNGVAVYYYKDYLHDLKTKYVDENTGKTTTVDRWVNPFTSAEPNKDLFDKEGNYDINRAFSNGYQPNNINGKKLTKVGTIDFTKTLGRIQNVFKTSDGKYWVWDGKSNHYVRAVQKGNKWVLA